MWHPTVGSLFVRSSSVEQGGVLVATEHFRVEICRAARRSALERDEGEEKRKENSHDGYELVITLLLLLGLAP